MKYNITYTVEKPNAHGLAPVRLCVTFSGGRYRQRLDNRINPKDWDTQRQQPQKNKALQVQREITAKNAQISLFFQECDISHRTPTIGSLRACFAPNSAKNNPTLCTAFENYLQTVPTQNSWTPGTLKQARCTLNHLRKFDSAVLLCDTTADTLAKFTAYLHSIGNRNSTTKKHIDIVRWCLRWCENNDYNTNPQWHKYKGKFKSVEQDIIYLTADELRQIISAEIKQAYLAQVRDVFLFCCFSGLRYSDALRLRPCDIYDDAIHVITKKTNDPLIIELNTITRHIIEKYTPEIHKNTLLLPVISNQKYNDYIKELCRVAGIETPITRRYFIGSECVETTSPKWQLITTHAARRTFVVSALTMSIPLEVIMKWTGHSDTKAIKPYMSIVEDLKKKEMNKLDSFAHTLPTPHTTN